MCIWMSDPYLYYNSIKDTPVCSHLDFNCLKFKYEVDHDILLFILAPGYIISLNKVCWRCVVLTFYNRHRCQTIEEFPIIGFYLYHVTSAGQSSNWTTSGI